METRRVFERHDPLSGDALQVALDGERLLVRVHAEGRASTVVLVDPADAARLRDALGAALDGPPHRDRLTRVPRRETA